MPSDKKLKIIHTEASPHWGGQEIRIFEEMKWFREQGHEMILVAPDNSTLYIRCKEEGFQVISVYFTKPRTLLNILKMLWVLWRLKPDVIGTHSSTDSWAGLIAAFLLKVRKRVRYRHVSAPVKRNLLKNLQYRQIANLIITTGDCISKNLCTEFRIYHEKIHTIATPISEPHYLKSKEEARKDLQSELGLEANSIFVGQVSVLRGWKGHLYLIESFKIIASRNPYIHLIIVGDGSMRECLMDTISRNKFKSRIHMIGHKDNVYDYLRSFSCSVLSSTKNEGIPQAILQSMYSNVPVIGTNIGGIPEIIKDRETGLLVKPQDPVLMAEAVLELLESERLQNKLKTNALAYVKKRFLWKTIGVKTYQLFMK